MNSSRSVLDNTGALTQVAELRGIAAHRIVADLDVAETSKFLLKTFHPTVLVFADAVGFDAADCYDDREKMGSLSLASERLHDPEKLVAEMTRLLAKHRAIWEARKDDPEDIAYNRRLTQEMLDEQARGMPRGHATACEACAQTAVLLYHFEDRFDHDASEICTIGVFAVGQICYFCDLQLTTYEQIDYFKLNQKIAQAYSSPFRRR